LLNACTTRLETKRLFGDGIAFSRLKLSDGAEEPLLQFQLHVRANLFRISAGSDPADDVEPILLRKIYNCAGTVNQRLGGDRNPEGGGIGEAVAKERGIFAKHNLDVEFFNFGGTTDQLLEAIATGKADAGLGLALRWLKPLEQGFDVRITTGVHGGCIRLLGSKAANIDSLESLRGKAIGISDQASPAKNFSAIFLAKNGIDPVQDIEWRQYPANLLALAVDKGEVQALAEIDPLPYFWLKDGKLNEIFTNLTGEFADRTCCVLAIRGSLIRSELPVAAALTRSILEAADRVASDPDDAAAVYSGYGGKGSVEDLAAMYRSHTHHNHPVGANLKKQLVLYTDELKGVNVIKKSTDSAKFAERIYLDVLS